MDISWDLLCPSIYSFTGRDTRTCGTWNPLFIFHIKPQLVWGKSMNLPNESIQHLQNIKQSWQIKLAETHSEHVAKLLLVRAEAEHTQDYLQNWCKAESNFLGWDFSRHLTCQASQSHCNSAYQKVQTVPWTAGTQNFHYSFMICSSRALNFLWHRLELTLHCITAVILTNIC